MYHTGEVPSLLASKPHSKGWLCDSLSESIHAFLLQHRCGVPSHSAEDNYLQPLQAF
jgi:hypothetical protein